MDAVLFVSSAGLAGLIREILSALSARNNTPSETPSPSFLDRDYIDEFLSRGVVVIRNALSEQEVANCRDGMHKYLLQKGIDHDNLKETMSGLSALSSTHGAGGILDVFYPDWKLRLCEHPKLFGIMSELWKNSYGSDLDYFRHDYGAFDSCKGYMYIDRICYRVPDAYMSGSKRHRLQRSLTPHLDCCPQAVVDRERVIAAGDSSFLPRKWRPIQCFVALTDTIGPNEGGFEACPGLHKRFQRWANNRLPSINNPSSVQAPCVGSFSPIRPIEDRDILALFEHIPCRAGDLVCWDYRIPHSNARRNDTAHPREVVYLGYLPDVEINRKYAQKQLSDFLAGRNPSDQWIEDTVDEPIVNNRGPDYQFSELGKRLLGMINW